MAPGARGHVAELLLLALGVSTAAGAQPVKVGPEFQVNTYITGAQTRNSVAADGNGNFIVVWDSGGSPGGDTSSLSVQAQRYDSTGTTLGSQFQVNTYTTSLQASASVGMDADGDLVVVWESSGSAGGDTSYTSIQGQRYSSAGSAVGSQFQVNTYTTDFQQDPCVAADADGDFVVVWRSNGSAGGDISGRSIQGQRYSSAGSALGSQFQVNTYTTDPQIDPSVAVDADGDFVVAWASYGSSGGDNDGYSIQGQRYNSAGSAVGGEFQVNTYTTSYQYTPSVAADPDGDFVVAWASYGSPGTDASGTSVQARRYNSAGSAVGGEFQINTYTTSYQARPSLATDADGGFVVVWQSYGSSGGDTAGRSVQGKRYSSAGNAIGGQFQVNTSTTNNQQDPSVAASADGDFVVVWERTFAGSGEVIGSSLWSQRFTTAPSVPSLSPAGLAVAALLMSLAAAVALRRRA